MMDIDDDLNSLLTQFAQANSHDAGIQQRFNKIQERLGFWLYHFVFDWKQDECAVSHNEELLKIMGINTIDRGIYQ